MGTGEGSTSQVSERTLRAQRFLDELPGCPVRTLGAPDHRPGCLPLGPASGGNHQAYSKSSMALVCAVGLPGLMA